MNAALRIKNMIMVFAVAFAVAGLLVTFVASAALIASRTVHTSAILTTANLGVYSDITCTQSLSSVDWGTLSPGASAIRTVYVKNTGNAQVTLSLWATNWNPAMANGPVAVSWNRQGVKLAAGQVLAATLMLSVSPGAGGFTSFSLDAVIVGTG